MSLRKLAEKAGISNPYLSQIERGLRKPSAEILMSIARALEISSETLYQRAGLLEPGQHPVLPIEDAVAADDQLTNRQKQVLIDVYRSFAAENAKEIA
jgi:transcriptional regulator with XRE-family HTH domain